MANVEHFLAQLLLHFDWKLADERLPQDMDMAESFRITVWRKQQPSLVPKKLSEIIPDALKHITPEQVLLFENVLVLSLPCSSYRTSLY